MTVHDTDPATRRPLTVPDADDGGSRSVPAGPFRGPAANRAGQALVLAVDVTAVLAATASQGPPRWSDLVYALLVLVSLAVGGAYVFRITIRPLEELPRLVTFFAVPLLLLWPVAGLGGTGQRLPLEAVTALAAVFAGRLATAALIKAGRRHGRFREPVLILGAGPVGEELVRIFQAHPTYGIVPVGFLDHVTDDVVLPVLGEVADLDSLLDALPVRRLVVAFGPTQEPELVDVLRSARHSDAEVHVVPRFFDVGIATTGPGIDDVWGIPLYRVRRAGVRPGAHYAKRACDVAGALPLLVVLAPVLAVTALAVRLTSPGPVLFRQRRIGCRGRYFDLLKFRTLLPCDDADTAWTVDSPARFTPVGRFLRRTSLDELPQLWNILRGDMSFVGPRPERPYFASRFGEEIHAYGYRHRMPVGLTGWAQVHGLRGDTSIAERARFDNHYIEHWSLWRDFIIAIRTVGTVLRRTDNSAADPARPRPEGSAGGGSQGPDNTGPATQGF